MGARTEQLNMFGASGKKEHVSRFYGAMGSFAVLGKLLFLLVPFIFLPGAARSSQFWQARTKGCEGSAGWPTGRLPIKPYDRGTWGDPRTNKHGNALAPLEGFFASLGEEMVPVCFKPCLLVGGQHGRRVCAVCCHADLHTEALIRT